MAEGLLRAALAERAPDVTIGSAGLLFDDRPAERHAVKAMARRGIDLIDFRSQRVTPELVSGASVVLGMERMHVRELAAMVPEAFDRIYTLPEFVGNAAVFGPRRDTALDQWTRQASQYRNPRDYLVSDPASEIADPMGGSARMFRRCADQMAELIDALVDLAWPAPNVAESTSGSPIPPAGGSR